MASMNDSTRTVAGPDSPDQKRVIRRFQEAWRRGDKPKLWEFLEEGGGNTSLLVELVYIDLRQRLEAGQSVRVEHYLEQFPVLMQNRTHLLDLLGSEFQLRRRRDKTVSVEEFIERFPGFRAELPDALAAPGRLDDTIILTNEKIRAVFGDDDQNSVAAAAKASSPAATAVAEPAVGDAGEQYSAATASTASDEASHTATTADEPSREAAAEDPDSHPVTEISDQALNVGAVVNQSQAATAIPQQDNTVVEPSLDAMVAKAQENAETLFHTDEPTAPKPVGASPRTNIPGFEILGELGRGGMGVVYKARHIGLNRLVALKMILSGQHAGQKDLVRFQAEAQVIAQLQNPNIVSIHDISQHEGFPYLALEYVDGGTLSDKLAGKAMEPRAAAELIRMAALAVHAAHEKGIIHRDLKPDNILLTSDGIPKLTDFGLAKHLGTDSVQTQTGTVMGTPGYMAPEQALGKTKGIGRGADIYSLGAILYEMLTGQPPFKGDTPVDTMLLVVNQEPLAPTRLVPTVPRDIETICLKCLQKDIQHRYLTAQEFADELERYLKNEPILARPISRAQRAARWMRRNAKMVAATSLFAIVFLCLSAALIYKIKTERQTTTYILQTPDGQQVEVPDAPDIKPDRSMDDLIAEANKLDEDPDSSKLEAISKTLSEIAARTDPAPAPQALAYHKVLETLVRARSEDAAVRAESLGQIKELLAQADEKRPDRLCKAVLLLTRAQPPALSVADAVGVLHTALGRQGLGEFAKGKIQDYLRELQTKQVKVDAIARKVSWADLLVACNEADANDSWVKAVKAEALLEKSAPKPSAQVRDEAGVLLTPATLKDVGDYASYVHALWYEASDKSVEAATELMQAFGKSPLSEALRDAERQKRAVQILLKSVDARKTGAESSDPFQAPFAKDALPGVYGALKAAYDLSTSAKLPLGNDLLSKLALAAWYNDKRDAQLTGKLLPLLKTAGLKPEEALQIQVLKVVANQDEPARRKDALVGYAQLLAKLQEHLKAKDATWSPMEWYKKVVEPGIAAGEKLQVNEKSAYDERQALARLYIEKGRLLGQDATLVGSDPYEQMKEANDRALKLDDKLDNFDKATCMLQRDIALMWLRKVDLKQFETDAGEMQKLAPEYAGARYLLGYVRSAEAREAARRKDWDTARAKRAEANQEYAQAIELLKKRDPYKELSVYFMERCNNWYEWSYLYPDIADREKRLNYLNEAIKDARAAIAQKPLHVDYANAFLGNALEDLAWWKGESDHYTQAAFAFDQARRKDLSKSQYWIDLARCKFRVVANARPADAVYKSSLQEGIKLLETIRDDEQKGKRKLTPKEKAESNFWLGKLYVLDNKLPAAAKAFDAVEALKSEPRTATWVAMALEENANALLKQAGVLADPANAEFKQFVGKAREQAQSLAAQPGKVHVAARLLGGAAQLEGKPAEALKEYQKGIDQAPLQADEASILLGKEKLNLLLDERWKVDLRGRNLPGTDAESVASQADALAVLSDGVPIYKAGIYGLAGEAHLDAADPDKPKQEQTQREAALAKLRVAVAGTLPEAFEAWRWRMDLAKVLRDLAKADNNKAYKDEALKALAEAEKSIPTDKKMDLQALKKELQS